MAEVEYGIYNPAQLGFDMPEVRGIIVGGCIARGVGSSFRRRAHAHNFKGDQHFGWICIRSRHNVLTRPGQPTRLVSHERAHIMTPNHWHDDAWRAAMRALGQPLPKHYLKRPRARAR